MPQYAKIKGNLLCYYQGVTTKEFTLMDIHSETANNQHERDVLFNISENKHSQPYISNNDKSKTVKIDPKCGKKKPEALTTPFRRCAYRRGDKDPAVTSCQLTLQSVDNDTSW